MDRRKTYVFRPRPNTELHLKRGRIQAGYAGSDHGERRLTNDTKIFQLLVKIRRVAIQVLTRRAAAVRTAPQYRTVAAVGTVSWGADQL